ncbi:hypothetical protein MRB53_040961 [Persea americana]|nr:hypothetical protein MRB53_040961 [Persea americana]
MSVGGSDFLFPSRSRVMDLELFLSVPLLLRAKHRYDDVARPTFVWLSCARRAGGALLCMLRYSRLHNRIRVLDRITRLTANHLSNPRSFTNTTMPSINVSLKDGASPAELDKAKKTVTEQGGKVTKEFTLIKASRKSDGPSTQELSADCQEPSADLVLGPSSQPIRFTLSRRMSMSMSRRTTRSRRSRLCMAWMG